MRRDIFGWVEIILCPMVNYVSCSATSKELGIANPWMGEDRKVLLDQLEDDTSMPINLKDLKGLLSFPQGPPQSKKAQDGRVVPPISQEVGNN